MNTKVGDNFVAHNLDTEFALFGVRTWEIWHAQGRAANQENLNDVEFMETKFASPLLTVKIRQPSHEFTFGVGMNFIPYPLVLTPVV
jgi:hypothetical protein